MEVVSGRCPSEIGKMGCSIRGRPNTKGVRRNGLRLRVGLRVGVRVGSGLRPRLGFVSSLRVVVVRIPPMLIIGVRATSILPRLWVRGRR